MIKTDEAHEALIEAVYKNGESLDYFGDFDEEAGEGHDVELLMLGSFWLVSESNDDKENFKIFNDEAEARETFAEVKTEIEEEEEDAE